MNRLTQLAFIGILAGAGAMAQSVITVRVGTKPEGARFVVDGRIYDTTQTMLWPEGSKHIVQYLYNVDAETGLPLPYQYGESVTVRYGFSGWQTNGPTLIPNGDPIQTVTAMPGLTTLTAQVTIEYKVRFQFYDTPVVDVLSAGCGAPGNAPQDGVRYGLVYADGNCFATTTEIWMAAGSHILNAFPYPGFVFTGFLVDGGFIDTNYLSKYTVSHSVQIVPLFMPAKRVRFSTNPVGLKIIVDGTIIQTPPGPPTSILPSSNIDAVNCSPDWTRLPSSAPYYITPLCVGDFDFLPGTVHKIGAPVSQNDVAGLSWVFTGYSNGLKNNDNYVVDNAVGTAVSLVANFAPGIPATFLTQPAGLKLDVDGRQNWPNYNFVWAAGEKHRVIAPPNQTDARGRKYVFAGWSNEGAPEQEVVVPNDRYGITLTAKYQILGQVRITSQPTGIALNADGESCTTPCTFDRASGTQMTLQATPSISNTFLSRYDFDNWDGQAETQLPVTFNTEVQTIRANYHTSFLLVANSDPVGQVTFEFAPSSSDGYFAEGTRVQVTVKPKGGYKFRRWDGDLNGTFNSGYLNMTSPHEVIARLDKVPFIPEAGLKNAAGETPDKTVGPGSIVAIYGENLAETLAVGPTSPLAQTLANITVTVNDRLLPLLFVSPKQINAQIPSDLADGVYVAKVKQVGQPDVGAEFTVRRNSPGLFTAANEQGMPLALALHEDGTPVTLDSPARRRETVSLFGTGFGPYDRRVIDGFIVPSDALYKLLDSAQVVTGDLTLTPQWTGAAPGFVGTSVMRLKVGDELPAASTIDLTVTINGAQSNRVQLPLE